MQDEGLAFSAFVLGSFLLPWVRFLPDPTRMHWLQRCICLPNLSQSPSRLEAQREVIDLGQYLLGFQ